MPKPCSIDLRARVIGAVEAGAWRREAAERFDLSPSAAIKWVKRYYETGSAGAKPCGGSISPLEEHTDWLLSLIAEQPDLTLDEIVAAGRYRSERMHELLQTCRVCPQVSGICCSCTP